MRRLGTASRGGPGSRQRWIWPGIAVAASLWAAFLLPPQVVVWDGASAPGWAQALADARPYAWIRDLAGALGVSDEYALFGALVGPSFLLIGMALMVIAKVAGRWTFVVGLLTVLGAPVSVMSYVSHDLDAPWSYFWGAEILVLLAIGITAIPAGVLSYGRRRLPRAPAALLAFTMLVLIASTALFTYFPHGSLVGYGVEVAILAASVHEDRAQGAGHGVSHERLVRNAGDRELG